MTMIRNLGPVRVVVLLGSIFLLFALFATVLMRVSTPPMSLLYGGMDAKEASEVVTAIQGMDIPVEVRAGGNIYVPQDQVAPLRLKVAGEGLVGGSTAGYEIFDNSSSFGTTSLVQNINAQRALQGELARTIQSMPAVKSARVHLVMPKRKLFTRAPTKPSASVAVNLGSRTLTQAQVKSIVHLVAAAVPDLMTNAVTVVDNRGTLLSSGGQSPADAIDAQSKSRRDLEMGYETRVTRMLERVVGPNKVNVKVSAEMNFDVLEEKSEIFDPENAVVRSEQRSEDNSTMSESSGNTAVGAAANIPGQEVGGAGSGSQSQMAKADETINYEVSKTIRRFVREGGTLERLSVAVLVEGRYEEGTYQPYNQNELEKFRTLVKTAVGYKEERGDTIEVIDMAFTQVEEEVIEDPLLTKSDYFRIGELVALILAIILIIFIVIKPMLKIAAKSSSPLDSVMEGGGGVSGANGPIAMGSEEAQRLAAANPNQEIQVVSPDTGEVVTMKAGDAQESMIDIAKVEGKVRESSIKKVTEIIEQYPEESVAVVRGWMNQDTGLDLPE